MFGKLKRWAPVMVLAILLGAVATAPPEAERWGDRLAWTLPIAAAGCSVVAGTWPEMVVRFGLLEAVVQGSKTLLGKRDINARPRGDFRGFPSAHSAHAAFGAGALLVDCIPGPIGRSALILAVGFTGVSRVDAGAHNPWQVLAGWIVGLAFARAFRSTTRRWFSRKSPTEDSDR